MTLKITIFGFFITTLFGITKTAEVHVVTSDHQGTPQKKPYYTVKIPPTVDQFMFKVKGEVTAYLGLTSDKFTQFQLQDMYEITVGTGTMIRTTGGRAATKLAGNEIAGPYASSTGQAKYLPQSQYGPYWVTWKDSRIAFGHGSIVGQETIWNTTVANYTYDINYIGLASAESNDTHWLFYDVEPLKTVSVDCIQSHWMTRFALIDMERVHINDNNTDTCVEGYTSDAGSFFSLMIYQEPPLEIMIKLKEAQSCKSSNIIVFDQNMNECTLTSDYMSGGLSECKYKCLQSCSPFINIGFQDARFGSKTWMICEIAEVRNMLYQIRNTSYV